MYLTWKNFSNANYIRKKVLCIIVFYFFKVILNKVVLCIILFVYLHQT